MAKYVIRNLDPTKKMEVRLYRLTEESTIVPPVDEFQNLDETGYGFGVILDKGFEVNTDGALGYAGELTLNDIDPAASFITDGTTERKFETVDQIVDVLADIGLTAVPVTPFIPEE